MLSSFTQAGKNHRSETAQRYPLFARWAFTLIRNLRNYKSQQWATARGKSGEALTSGITGNAGVGQLCWRCNSGTTELICNYWLNENVCFQCRPQTRFFYIEGYALKNLAEDIVLYLFCLLPMIASTVINKESVYCQSYNGAFLKQKQLYRVISTSFLVSWTVIKQNFIHIDKLKPVVAKNIGQVQ